MKEGWEYKKLGEVCTKVDNIKWQTVSDDEEYTYIDLSSVDRSNCIITDTTFINKTNAPSRAKQIIKPEDVLFGTTRPTLKRVCVIGLEHDENICSTGFCVLRAKKNIVSPQWIFYQLLSDGFYSYIEPLQSGANYPAVSDKIVKSYQIPLPPLSEQQQIVEELDLLSSIIEKKKEQLKELDALAQSIFYDMFGDPKENNKAFDVYRLGDVCNLKAGKAIRANELHEEGDNLYPCYGGNGVRGYINKFSHSGNYPIIGRQGALCGNVNFAKGEFYATEHAVVVSSLINLDSIWLYYALKAMNLEQYAHGVAQPGLSVKDLLPLSIIIPPLSLQQEFASKIEAIEQQKELIKQSIKETETLFNSRMDYYFN